MAVPTYDDLLAHHNMKKSIMKQTFDDEHLREFSLTLDELETLAKFLNIPNSDITGIKNQGNAVEQRMRMLERWKQRCGSMATYEAMAKALLQIGRTDLAEKVITLRKSPRDIPTPESAPTNQILLSPGESSLATPTSPASSSGIEDASSPAAMSPLSLPAIPSEQITQSLRELEEEFYNLVTFTEDTLEKSKVNLNTMTRRFSMLPQSIKRQHQTDESYKKTRRRILNSETVKKLFDNLTELKHWNYMTPDTLAHILKDVKIDDIHKKVGDYKEKLVAFKANTKLRELIGISFPVPDYCIELTMEVEGWEDKSIQEAENEAVNIVRRAVYSGSPHVSLGWKGVDPGSIKLMFILTELVREKSFEEGGVVSVQIDEESFHSREYMKAAPGKREVPGRLWVETTTVRYNAGGGRDVLVLAPGLSLPHPDAVPRRSGQLTGEDKKKLQSQGLHLKFVDDLDIVRARYDLDNRQNVVDVKSGLPLSRDKVVENIAHLLNTTQNDGVVLHYIGAGRRGTGDWCFEDGFITFRDIAQLYQKALSHNFRGRVLSIVSDCSYSGCWVRDCMEFLDEQGVQPCGHKAREKGMIIKVFASCKPNEIPTEYRYITSATRNDRSTGYMIMRRPLQFLETQTTDCIDSSLLKCDSKTIDEPCTLPPGLTWRRGEEMKRVLRFC